MRLVIKIGTNVIVEKSGKVDLQWLEKIVEKIVELKNQKHEVVLVSSGAIGLGRQLFPTLKSNAQKQVWAAVGQAELMKLYSMLFGKHKVAVGQCMLLRNDFTRRLRYDHFLNMIEGLLASGAVPILNENDPVALGDLTVGDNDLFSAMVSVALDVDKLYILTDIGGVFTDNPVKNPGAELIPIVENVDSQFEKMFKSQPSLLGRGGMLSKVRAAKHAVHAGIETIIFDGRDEKSLKQLGSKVITGTIFKTNSKPKLNAQKRWLLAVKGYGQLVIDPGAVKALLAGKSLLFPGVIKIRGIFEKHETLEIVTPEGKEIAYGKVNYTSEEIAHALELKSQGKKTGMEKELVHCDYMVIVSNKK